jgi:hypothetical protein
VWCLRSSTIWYICVCVDFRIFEEREEKLRKGGEAGRKEINGEVVSEALLEKGRDIIKKVVRGS